MSSIKLLIPESPMITTSFASPDPNNEAESSTARLHRIPSYLKYQPPPIFAIPPTPRSVLNLLQTTSPSPKSSNLRPTLILQHALKYALQHGDVELTTYLAGLTGRWEEVLDEVVLEMEDDDGWGIVGMGVLGSCGRQEVEEGVRCVVGRWGLDVGPRGGRDHRGWTALHLAALVSTPPLVSFLLTRGASTSTLTVRGLTPMDIIADMPDRQDICSLLDHSPTASQPVGRQNMLDRRRARVAGRARRREGLARRMKANEERERWIRDWAGVVDVDPDVLLPPKRNKKGWRRSQDSGLGEMDGEESEGSEREESEAEDDTSLSENVNESMMAFSMTNLESILDILIKHYRPVCLPLASRTLPANALYLYARFAHYRCDETWLEELIEQAVETIEHGVYGHSEDLPFLAFWAYNTTVLLYLIRSDEELHTACVELNLMSMIEELINAIHVFVIRVAERRVDAVLDAAILDHETLETLDEVRFEGEWSLFRSFGTKKQRGSILPKASQIFANGSSPGGSGEVPTSPSAYGSMRDNVPGSTYRGPARSQSIQDLRMAATPRSGSIDSIVNLANGVNPPINPGPQQITDLLSGVLVILQLYEVNPCITIQAFSQIFFWIACELFNRILTRKKYLCRTKALQIRMNITVLEDWVRSHDLPPKIATKHFEGVVQLLQWLQCSSSVREFDMLIVTMQGLRGINPLQMRRAVRDYKYEVGEGRMTEECGQYLVQLQKDWERRRVDDVRGGERRRISEGSNSNGEGENGGGGVDSLFEEVALADFTPQTAPECLGELLDSRYMLPFLLPEENAHLVATPPSDSAYQGFVPGAMSMPGSRSSFSVSKPMRWSRYSEWKLRKLPEDFFGWWRDKEIERRLGRAGGGKKVDLIPTLAVNPPLGPSQRVNLPNKPGHGVATPKSGLQSVLEDEGGPVPSFPPLSLRNSDSMEMLREPIKIPFQPVREPSHTRSDSFELKIRSSALSPKTPHSAPVDIGRAYPISPTPSLQYELTRNKRDSGGFSLGGQGVVSPKSYEEGSGKGKWWKLGRSFSGSGSEEDRSRREMSEDTVMGEDGLTPSALSPGAGGKGKFWDR